MAINAYSIQLITTLLDGSTTQIPSPGSASTGSVLEVFGGFPMRIPGGTSDQNIKLGLLSDPLWLAVYGDEGISFQILESSLTGKISFWLAYNPDHNILHRFFN